MDARNILGYEGKQVVVTGAASGMGQAAAGLLTDLGAEVYALDVRNVDVRVKRFIQTDLMEKSSIDAAVEKIPGNIYALFNCAGLGPDRRWSALQITLVNFVGTRHLAEDLIPRIEKGGGIATISSIGGMNWKRNYRNVKPLLATSGFDEARAWLEAHPDINKGYEFSKECVTAYVITRSVELAKKEIRFNCLSPGPTATPMMDVFHKVIGKEMVDRRTVGPAGRYGTPEEMAEPLVFLNSKMARFISGEDLWVNFGFGASMAVSEVNR